MSELGTIEQVDLRDMWPKGETDFTPWLSENISKLGKVLGMYLALRCVEAPIGPYSLAILAQD